MVNSPVYVKGLGCCCRMCYVLAGSGSMSMLMSLPSRVIPSHGMLNIAVNYYWVRGEVKVQIFYEYYRLQNPSKLAS